MWELKEELGLSSEDRLRFGWVSREKTVKLRAPEKATLLFYYFPPLQALSGTMVPV